MVTRVVWGDEQQFESDIFHHFNITNCKVRFYFLDQNIR